VIDHEPDHEPGVHGQSAGQPRPDVDRRHEGWRYFLGHKNASETLDTYSHLWPDNEDKIRAAID
jgi:hypothetical protein